MRKFIMDKYNLIAFAIGLIPTILLYLFPPDAAVPFWAFSIVLFFLLIAIWMCAKLWLESKNDKAVPTISIIECSHNVCICKTHDFITYNSIVTFYKKDGNFEKLIGFGLVETINSGGKSAQIRIVPGDMRNKNQVSASEISDFVSYINDNKNNIIVRPTITSDIVPYIYKILNQEVSMSKQIKIVHVPMIIVMFLLMLVLLMGYRKGTNFWYILFPTTRSWIRIPGNP